jgi:hypothetical protein
VERIADSVRLAAGTTNKDGWAQINHSGAVRAAAPIGRGRRQIRRISRDDLGQ